MKNRITTLFLDIGGVLLSNGWGHDFRKLTAEKFNIDYQEMEERHNIMFVTYEEGRITLNEYFDRVIFYKQRDFTQDQLREFMFSLSTPDLEMISFIKKIKAQYHLKIVAVSNEARELNAYRIRTFGLDEIFDFFVSSCYVQLRKPDPAIYKMALDTANVLPGQVIYIDDVQIFVDIAAGLGIKSIQHANMQSTSKALTALGFTTDQMKLIHA